MSDKALREALEWIAGAERKGLRSDMIYIATKALAESTESGGECPECGGSGDMDLHDVDPEELEGLLASPECQHCNGTGLSPEGGADE